MIPRQFVFISTLSVFGPIREKTYTPITGKRIPLPNTAYGLSKLKAERYLQGMSDFPYVIYRPTGVYGPREGLLPDGKVYPSAHGLLRGFPPAGI